MLLSGIANVVGNFIWVDGLINFIGWVNVVFACLVLKNAEIKATFNQNNDMAHVNLYCPHSKTYFPLFLGHEIYMYGQCLLNMLKNVLDPALK